MGWGVVELEPEVRDWLEQLPAAQFAHAAWYVDLLAVHGPPLDEPYADRLDGDLRVLRLYLQRDAVRIAYWIAPARRIVLLTVFRKVRMREERAVERSCQALARCRAEQRPGRTVDGKEANPMGRHSGWDELRARRMAEPGAAESYDAARLANDLGRRIRQLREDQGWSQTQLARQAGMTQSAVARFEAGGTVPTLPVLERLAEALDVELSIRLTPRAGAP